MAQYHQQTLVVRPVEYSPKCTIAQLRNDAEMQKFAAKWRASNFYRGQKEPKLTASLEEKFASAKHDRPYVLYRGIKEYVRDEIYFDPLPSSWSTNIAIARHFGADGMVMRMDVPARFVMCDLELLNLGYGNEREVIIMPGLYRVDLPDIDYNTPVPTIIEMMHSDVETLEKRWRMPNILKFCHLKEIRKLYCKRKTDLIKHCKLWLKTHAVPVDE